MHNSTRSMMVVGHLFIPLAMWLLAAFPAAGQRPAEPWIRGAEPGVGVSAEATQTTLLDSGWVRNNAPGSGVRQIFVGTVRHPGSMWLRLGFLAATLSGEIGDADASYLLITGEQDGAVQQLYAEHLSQWSMRSAYFNGDAVRVELYAAPGTGPSRVRIGSIEFGEPGYLDRSLCGPADDRVLADDPASARLLPGYCTAWLVNDRPYGLLSAGHCVPPAGSVVQFNVPLSTIGGSMRHPPPEDQYPVDPASIQVQSGSATSGNDWVHFGVFENCNTGLSPLEAQGASYQAATSVPPVDGRTVRVGGYGLVSLPTPLTRNYVYTEHSGPYVGSAGNSVRYQADTTGGDSGSAVIDESTGLAIAIHTNAGCNGSGSNKGTATKHPDLRQALDEPRGTCARTDGVLITYPRPRPAEVSPSGGTVLRARFRPSATRSPVMETATLHVFDGSAWVSVPMAAASETVAVAPFPATTGCVGSVRYYVSIENSLGETDVSPAGAPASTYQTRVAHASAPIFASDFAIGDGWAIGKSDNLVSGVWKSGTPGNDGRGTPDSDFDQTGTCGLTGPEPGDDVDGGPSVMSSRTIDLREAFDPVLSFAAWYVSTDFEPEGLRVEYTTDGGVEWNLLEAIGPTDGWEVRVYRLWDVVPPTQAFRVRFVAEDDPNFAIVEAAIDRVRIDDHLCVRCPGDLTGDGSVDGSDLRRLLEAVAGSDPSPDLTGDGALDAADVLAIIGAMGGACP